MPNKKHYDDDDGRVIADMNVKGLPWYDKSLKKDGSRAEPLKLTRKEKRAIRIAAVLAILPQIAIIILSLCVTFILIRLWLM